MNESIPSAPVTTAQDVLGPRIVAGIIDFVILFILFAVMAAIFSDSDSGDSGFSLNLSGLPFVIYLVLVLGYYFGLEMKTGQTVGKMVMKLKVVSLDGQPLTPGKVAIRTILRIIDGFFFYLVAVIVIAVSKQKQRLGDMAAGTAVVRA